MKETYLTIKLPESVDIIVFKEVTDIQATDKFEQILTDLIKSPKYINLFGDVVQKAKDEALNILAHEIGKSRYGK